jgi:hypothetical protein
MTTVTDLLQDVPTRLFSTCYVQTTSDFIEQPVPSLLASSTLLQDGNNMLYTDLPTTGNKQ